MFIFSIFIFFILKVNVWPPVWQKETEGYLHTQGEREKEIMELPGADERWENWMQHTQVFFFINFIY